MLRWVRRSISSGFVNRRAIPHLFIRGLRAPTAGDWGIKVVGCIPGGIGVPAEAPYIAALELAGIIGTEGIEVIGANKSKRIRLDGSSEVDR
jgi:hypothetical protein